MPTLTVQTGPRNARTDPESGLRFYRWKDRDLVSVTSARRAAGVPFGLHNWAIGKVIDRAVVTLEEIDHQKVYGKWQDDWQADYRKALRAAATEERDKAAKLGTAVHDAAASNVAVADAPEELRARLGQFYDWTAASEAQIIASEFQVFNLAAGYAGTVDALVRFPSGQTWLVDYKTGKGVYGDHALQLSAYAHAEFAGSDDAIDERTTRLLKSIAGMAVLHLADDHWEFMAIRNDDETYAAFLGLLAFARWELEHRDAASFVTGSKRGEA